MTACLECREKVEFNSKKQEYYEKHNFPHPPMFCSNCQSKRLLKTWDFSGLNRTATCSDCKKETTLHFTPNYESPIKCNQCYESSK